MGGDEEGKGLNQVREMKFGYLRLTYAQNPYLRFFWILGGENNHVELLYFYIIWKNKFRGVGK